MLRNKIKNIFHRVQQSSACHQRYLQVLFNLYNESSLEDFTDAFMYFIDILFRESIVPKNHYVERCLDFAATFVSYVVEHCVKGKDCNNVRDQDDDENNLSHPFLSKIFGETLKYHNLDHVQVRFHTCEFIALIMKYLSDDAQLDNDVCDSVEAVMLERILDLKSWVRLQAVHALLRLQDPTNPDCPVIKGYLICFGDPSPQVRKEIVEKIAPCPNSIPKILERTHDTDYTVRLTAYKKIAMVGPKVIKIIDRQSLCLNGFYEEHKVVQRYFIEGLLPKWLSCYDGDFFKLLNALKLDADEEDIKQTALVSQKVLEVFFKSHAIKDVIDALPLAEGKTVPINKLSSEVVIYWYFLSNFLRQSENTEDYLLDILPELSPFCDYLERFIKEKSSKHMEPWEQLEYQNVLKQLFEMAGQYDLGDEVGRQALHKLITNTLTDEQLDGKVVSTLIKIMDKVNTDIDNLTTDICHIISDIREPLVERGPTQQEILEKEFKLARLAVQMNILNDTKEQAVAKSDFHAASEAQEQLKLLTEQVNVLKQSHTSGEKVKTVRDDVNTLCRCLDILIGILSLHSLNALPVFIRNLKDEFVSPLLSVENIEIYIRVFKCIVLCSIVDRQVTMDNLKFICTPIVVYRLMQPNDKAPLLVAIAAVSDLLRVHGTNIFAVENDASVPNNTTATNNSTVTNNTTMSSNAVRKKNATRRLYRIENMDELQSFDFDVLTSEHIIDAIVDMLDDEASEVRECAGAALMKLLLNNIGISPSLISRILLKWLNPLTEKHDQKLQQLFGISLLEYAQEVDGSLEVLEKAVIPTLSGIGNAPRTSPLADIDIDNALRFLAALTGIKKNNELVNVHKNLAYALCYKISNRLQDRCVPIYIKMLLYLEPPLEDPVATKELLNQAETLLEEIQDKTCNKNIFKYIVRLNGVTDSRTYTQSLTTGTHSHLGESKGTSPVSVNNRNLSAEPSSAIVINGALEVAVARLSGVSLQEATSTGVKRRKSRGRTTRSVAPQISAEEADETTLHTILERSEQMDILEEDNMTIETPTTDSGSSGKGSDVNNRKEVIISETSSDSEPSKGLRRSKRRQKNT